ncbi:hypothetical protein FJZ20_00535 [Candidatus Pacearchaeota archaeon]|nr:hypothetical protein [Candidatus Pacearchaeota archaeon]
MIKSDSRKKISSKEAREKIQNFFSSLNNRTPKEIKKIKRLAMKHNLKLKDNKKNFCRKCLSIYKNPKIRIKRGIKNIECETCGYISRWKIKKSY